MRKTAKDLKNIPHNAERENYQMYERTFKVRLGTMISPLGVMMGRFSMSIVDSVS